MPPRSSAKRKTHLRGDARDVHLRQERGTKPGFENEPLGKLWRRRAPKRTPTEPSTWLLSAPQKVSTQAPPPGLIQGRPYHNPTAKASRDRATPRGTELGLAVISWAPPRSKTKHVCAPCATLARHSQADRCATRAAPNTLLRALDIPFLAQAFLHDVAIDISTRPRMHYPRLALPFEIGVRSASFGPPPADLQSPTFSSPRSAPRAHQLIPSRAPTR